MLTNDPFYWGTVRKIVAAVGSLFSDIHIVRTNPNDANDTKTIKVPLNYGPKEKWIYRTKQNPMPGVDDQVEMILPRMSFEITGFQYDESRKLTSTGRTMKELSSDNTVLKAQFNPVPYNIGFNLNIMTKTLADGLMIVEQILPFFTPDYTITVNDIPDLDLKKDIPVVLNGMQTEDTWDGDFTVRRTITFILTFTAKAYLYPPVKMTKVVLSSQMNFLIDDGTGTSALPSVTTVPSPDGASATTITDGNATQVDASVRIMVLPATATLASSQSKVFNVGIINTDDLAYTVSGASPKDSTSIAGNNFTYTAGVRTSPETVTLIFVPHADTTREAVVVLSLTP